MENWRKRNSAASQGKVPRSALEAYRLELGLTRKEFAKRLGVPEVTLRSWERGRSQPSEESRERIKRALGVDLFGI